MSLKRQASQVWETAHRAMMAKDWAHARNALDTMASLPAVDYLSPTAYGAPTHIVDRVNAHNARVSQS